MQNRFEFADLMACFAGGWRDRPHPSRRKRFAEGASAADLRAQSTASVIAIASLTPTGALAACFS